MRYPLGIDMLSILQYIVTPCNQTGTAALGGTALEPSVFAFEPDL